MSDCIQLLPDHVANQIAAGEVVQRPASVVKELLENAIDAKGTVIKLLLKDAGKTRTQVIDNGVGMSVTDARMCFERHATSKIKDAKDLFDLHTKGFRGEAMASIAAISHVELMTKQADQEVGTHIKIEGSKVVSQEATSMVVGTSVSVKNLFYNIPARRNFLKSDAVETRHVVDEFQRVALAHPDIEFSMVHNDTEVYHLKGSNLKQRIVAIFGGKTNEKLVPIAEETDVLSVNGFVAKPEFSKKKRGEQFFFVNSRFIKSPYLHHAVVSAFEGLLGQGYHPSYFLYLKVPRGSIDINIHPTKTEVKFDNEKVLYAMVRAVVKHGLGQHSVAPVLDFKRDATMDIPYAFKDKSIAKTKAPSITVDPTFNPFKTEQQSFSKGYKKEQPANWESLYAGLEVGTLEKNNSPAQLFETPEEKGAEVGKTYQIHKKYILSSTQSGVLFIHQHLAHQRVLYEHFLKNSSSKGVFSQQLLFPVEVSFAAHDIETIKNFKEDLEQMGFLFGEISTDKIVVKGIPTVISESQITMTIEQLLDDIEQGISAINFKPSEMIAKSLAKTLAIKTGQILLPKEQETLVNDLFLCEEPSIAPCGKKAITTVDLQELDKLCASKS